MGSCSNEWKRGSAGICAVLLVLVLPGCGSDTGTDPALGSSLSGSYLLEEWIQTSGVDTLRLTEDSYLRMEFKGDRVEGEGLLKVHARMPSSDGTPSYGTQKVLGRVDAHGDLHPLELRGWHYIRQTEDGPRLVFRLRQSEGAGTWLEIFDWKIEENFRGWFTEMESTAESLRIVLRVP
jgi:hypothetical protein